MSIQYKNYNYFAKKFAAVAVSLTITQNNSISGKFRGDMFDALNEMCPHFQDKHNSLDYSQSNQ